MAILNGHEVAFSKPSFNTRNGTLDISENGEYEVETYEKVAVDVAGGGNIGYQVKFKVDGEDYYIASCKQSESISEPPTPIISGKSFNGWITEQAQTINFPYIPNANIELTANMSNYNFLAGNNETIVAYNNSTYLCKNLSSGNGFAGDKDLVGYWYLSSGFTNPLLITKTQRTGAISRGGYTADANNAITYHGKTYYYATGLGWDGNYTDTSGLNRYKCTDGLTEQEAAIELLDAYFGN